MLELPDDDIDVNLMDDDLDQDMTDDEQDDEDGFKDLETNEGI
jgi:hypothetical protein